MKKQIFLIILLFLLNLLCGCTEKMNATSQNNFITITFDGNGGVLVSGSEIIKVYDIKELFPPVYEREGYTFSGWSVNLNEITCDTNIKAIWECDSPKWSVFFDANGGVLESDKFIYIEDNKKISEPSIPYREGYTFEGWYLNDEKWSFIGYVVTEDIELKAKWAINQYTITYKYNDEITEDLIITQDFGTKIEMNNPKREGYTFLGWSENIDTTPSENIIIEASWTINQYSLIYNFNDGVTEDIIITQDYGSNIEIPKPSMRIGYTFINWSENFLTMPAENKTINALWMCDIIYNIKDGQLKIIGYNINKNKIIILDEYEGFKPMSIELGAFSHCSSLTSITIPDSVASIGEYAFSYCSSLTSITIPDSVTSIGGYAFYCCPKLISVTIGNGVTSIGERTFYNCSSLTSVTIGNGVTSIGNSAFFGCSSLTSVTMGNCVTSIGYRAFYYCSSLTSITIPDSVTSIGEDSFSGCSSLESITLPFVGNKRHFTNDNNQYPFGYIFGIYYYDGSVTAYQNSKRYYIPSTLRTVVITDSLIISNCAFSGCSSLTSIIIPDSVTSIEDSAFYNCSSLTSITIPDSVASIGKYAFSYCSSLTSITIPNSVTSIGDSAFYNCSSLQYNVYENCNYLGNGENSYLWLISATNKTMSTYTINENTRFIYDKAFCNCSSLQSITIPNSVTSIGDSAFTGCSSLVTITLPFIGDKRHFSTDTYQYSFGYIFGTNSYGGETATVQSYYGSNTSVTISSAYYIPSSLKSIIITDSSYIPFGAFYNCSSLTSITIPDSVTSIGDSAFTGCSSLTSITIPESFISIGNSVFSCCSSLTSITIPDSVRSIESYAFNNCSSLTSITIPDSVRSIGKSAFSGCSSLTSIAIPDSVTSIGDSAFSCCSSLTSVTIGNGVTLIGSHAFSYCSSLKSIIIPNNVTSIEDSAFYNCSSLTSVTIGNGVTLIGSHAFSYCSSLTLVTMGNGVTSIEISAFSYCSSLTSITIPNSVVSIETYAFTGCSSLETITLPFVGDKRHFSTDYNQYPFGYIFGSSGYDGGVTIYQNSNNYCIPSTLRTVVITDSTYISYDAFYNCSSLKSIIIPDSVTSIGDSAFYNCSSLTSITIGNGTTLIGERAFQYCSSLTSITIPNSVISIGSGAFQCCPSLTSITIPNSVTSIGRFAFYNCSSLQYNVYENCNYLGNEENPYLWLIAAIDKTLSIYTINENAKFIYDDAFNNCSITSITIPNSVTSIGSLAFFDCSSLQYNVYENCNYLGNEENPYLWLISVIDKTMSTYIINESTKIIYGGAFSYCSSLISITIPNGAVSIGKSAFSSCSKLTSIIIPNSVTSIGSGAFSYCSSLQSITIPNSIKSIGNYTFYHCSSLTSITIPNSVTSIGESAFDNCSSLTSVTIGNGITSIEESTFYHCSSLTSITIPNSVTSIGESAFSYCSSLTSITIPNSIKSIGSGAFSSCSSLISFTIPNSVSSIGRYAFDNCSSLQYNVYENCNYLGNEENPYLWLISVIDKTMSTYIINESTKIIYGGAFSCCSSLISITIPNGAVSIGKSAFSSCSKLTSIIIPNSVTSIGSGAFSYCSSLQSITIPNSVTSIGEYAFLSCQNLKLIKFLGTENQWNLLSKANEWNSNIGTSYMIIYTDYNMKK